VISAWAAWVPSLAVAARLRLHAIEAAPDSVDGWWLRGDNASEDMIAALIRLPRAQRFRRENDLLFPLAGSVPEARLPPLTWKSLAQVATVSVDPPAMPGSLPPPTTLSLVDASDPRPAEVMTLPWRQFADWAVAAAAIRLQRLAFAVGADAQAVIVGSPLPPLNGQFFYRSGAIAIPVGKAIAPAVDATTLSTCFALETGDIALVTGHEWRRIKAIDLVAARRAAVRMTDKRLRTP
jgi:hypothetical protein